MMHATVAVALLPLLVAALPTGPGPHGASVGNGLADVYHPSSLTPQLPNVALGPGGGDLNGGFDDIAPTLARDLIEDDDNDDNDDDFDDNEADFDDDDDETELEDALAEMMGDQLGEYLSGSPGPRVPYRRLARRQFPDGVADSMQPDMMEDDYGYGDEGLNGPMGGAAPGGLPGAGIPPAMAPSMGAGTGPSLGSGMLEDNFDQPLEGGPGLAPVAPDIGAKAPPPPPAPVTPPLSSSGGAPGSIPPPQVGIPATAKPPSKWDSFKNKAKDISKTALKTTSSILGGASEVMRNVPPMGMGMGMIYRR